MPTIDIVKGYFPGAIGRVAELNGTYYHTHWGFGLIFEAMCATDLSEFLKRYDETRDGFWTVWSGGRIEGHLSIDGIHSETKGAHLRYFILSDGIRGQGVGNRLITTAMDFCRNSNHNRCISGPSRACGRLVICMRKQVSGSSSSDQEPSGAWK